MGSEMCIRDRFKYTFFVANYTVYADTLIVKKLLRFREEGEAPPLFLGKAFFV